MDPEKGQRNPSGSETQKRLLARTWSQGSLGTLSPGEQGQDGRRGAQVMHVVSSALGVWHTSGSQRDSVSMREERRGVEFEETVIYFLRAGREDGTAVVSSA